MWLPQDGTTTHFANETIQTLKKTLKLNYLKKVMKIKNESRRVIGEGEHP